MLVLPQVLRPAALHRTKWCVWQTIKRLFQWSSFTNCKIKYQLRYGTPAL